MIDYAALKPLVEKAARAAHSSFPSHHDVDDTTQAIYLWVVEKENTIRDIITNTERPEGVLYNLMVKVANSHLKEEDQATYHYSEEDAFYYSTSLIKSILEVVFDHEDWQSFATALDAMPKGKSDPATAGNNIASYCDVARAVNELEDEHYNVIVWRYKYHLTFEQIGAEIGASKQAAHRRHDGAVSAIQKALGKKDLSDLRKSSEPHLRPRTTAAAQAELEQNY